MLRRHGRNVGVVDYNDTEEEDIHISYCRHCLEYGFRNKLQPRILKKGEVKPPDYDEFIQCHECGNVFPTYEKKNEAMIKDVVETVDNPFDIAKDQFLGFDKRKGRMRAKKKKELFGEIKDPDLRRELASGQTKLISYTIQDEGPISFQ